MAKCFFVIFCTLGISLAFLCCLVLIEPTTADLNASTYSTKERIAIDTFRRLMEKELYQDYMKTDEYLIRWIRNQGNDLEKAKTKLSKSLKWRKDNKIDGIIGENFADLEKACPYSIDAKDRSGRPVMTMDFGKCSFRKIAIKGQGGHLRRLNYYFIELAFRAVNKLQKENKSITDIIALVDYNSFSLREHGCIACLQLYIEMTSVYEEHYPRLMHKLIGINAPKSLRTVLESLWPFLSEELKSVFFVYGHDRSEWQPVILQDIDANQIPRKFGGTKN